MVAGVAAGGGGAATRFIAAPASGVTLYFDPSKESWTLPPGLTVTGKPGDCAPESASRTSPPPGRTTTTGPGDSWTATRTVAARRAIAVPG